MARKLIKWVLIASGAISWLIIAFMVLEHITFKHERLPNSVMTLSDFLSWHAPPSRAYRITVRGATYFVLEGDVARFQPSGPASYTFDKYGNLVDWSVDCWDSERPRVVAADEAEDQPVSVEDVITLVDRERAALGSK
jgi:hypothetical protein